LENCCCPLSLPLGGVAGLLFIGGGVDCVGQLALASITDPSGHVCVDGDVGYENGFSKFCIKILAHSASVQFLAASVVKKQIFTLS
jgi:hypothetical protein